MLKDFALSLSLANLCFIKVWRYFLSSAHRYFFISPAHLVAAGIIADVILLTTIFFLCITLLRRRFSERTDAWLVAAIFVVALTVVNVLLTSFNFLPLGMLNLRKLIAVAAAIIVALVILALWRKCHRLIANFASVCVLLMLPFAALTFAQTLKVAFFENRLAASETKALSRPAESESALRRIVWITFDELDEHLTFEHRPTGLELPELDKLRRESLYTTSAYPPAMFTQQSIPALLVGRLLSKVELRGGEMFITYDGETGAHSLGSQPNIFRDARQFGRRAAVVGWYHPYCGLFGAELERCYTFGEQLAKGDSVFKEMGRVALSAASAIPYAGKFLPVQNIDRASPHHSVTYSGELQEAKDVLRDTRFDFVYLHFPIPHPPGIYDRKRGALTNGASSYLDNLALVDETLGALRREMEKTGEWDDSVVLVTSDHWWRYDLWRGGGGWTTEDEQAANYQINYRVPFLLKMANQKRGATYEGEFNTVVTRELLSAMMSERVKTPEDVKSFLEAHRGAAQSPYYK